MKATLKCNPERLPDRGLPTKDIHVKPDLPDLPITIIPRVKPSKPKKPNKRKKAFVPERKDLWTPESDKELMRRYWDGESYEDIGKAIGRSAHAVKVRANAIRNEKGQRPRKSGRGLYWQESERDWSKVNRGANNGKYGRPVFWTDARCAVLRQLKEEGKSYKEIAEEMGKSSEACRRQWYVINGYCLNGRK